MDLDSTPHQQMDLTVEPVYRRPYKFSQLTPFGYDAQCHQMSTVEDIDLKLRQNIEHVSLDFKGIMKAERRNNGFV